MSALVHKQTNLGAIGLSAKLALAVVEADRPEAVHGNVFNNVELVNGRPVVFGRGEVEIDRVLPRVAAPRCRC